MVCLGVEEMIQHQEQNKETVGKFKTANREPQRVEGGFQVAWHWLQGDTHGQRQPVVQQHLWDQAHFWSGFFQVTAQEASKADDPAGRQPLPGANVAIGG